MQRTLLSVAVSEKMPIELARVHTFTRAQSTDAGSESKTKFQEKKAAT